MIVKVEFPEELDHGQTGDRIIRAIDKALNGASWESVEGKQQSWIAKK